MIELNNVLTLSGVIQKLEYIKFQSLMQTLLHKYDDDKSSDLPPVINRLYKGDPVR